MAATACTTTAVITDNKSTVNDNPCFVSGHRLIKTTLPLAIRVTMTKLTVGIFLLNCDDVGDGIVFAEVDDDGDDDDKKTRALSAQRLKRTCTAHACMI